MKNILKGFSARIYLLALLLRLAPVVLAANLPIGLDDMFQYDMLARGLAAGEGYRWYAEDDLHLVERYIAIDFISDDYDPRGVLTSFRAPAYPAFLAVVYRISGLEGRLLAARLVQAALMAIIAPLTYFLARRTFPDEERIGRFAAGVIAFYPFLLVYPLGLLTENLFLPLFLGSVLALLRAGETRKTRDFLLAGLLLGLAVLTRSVALAVAAAAVLWVWLATRDRKGALLLVVCVTAVTAPWIARNSLLHGELTMIETSLGYNLHMGYYPDGSGTFRFESGLELLPYLDDAERDRIGSEMALGFIQADPGRVPELAVRKLGHFFALEHRPLVYFYSNGLLGYLPPWTLGLAFGLLTLPFALLALLTAVGLAFSPWRKETALMGLVFGAYLAPHAIIMAEPRLHLAVLPILAVWAGYAWVRRRTIWAQVGEPGGRWRLAAAVITIALLVTNWSLAFGREAEQLAVLFGPEGNQAYFNY